MSTNDDVNVNTRWNATVYQFVSRLCFVSIILLLKFPVAVVSVGQKMDGKAITFTSFSLKSPTKIQNDSNQCELESARTPTYLQVFG